MPLEDKIEANPYTMIDSPSPERAADADFPDIIDEAFQVFECTWDDRFELQSKTDAFGRHYDSHFNLMIDSILVREKYAPGIEKGEIFPNTPIFYGFRANRGFWLAKHEAPFSIPLPKVEGMTIQSVTYLANRINSNVRFTDEACKQLTDIPEPFMKDALKGIVEHALADGVTDVDEAYLAKVNAERE